MTESTEISGFDTMKEIEQDYQKHGTARTGRLSTEYGEITVSGSDWDTGEEVDNITSENGSAVIDELNLLSVVLDDFADDPTVSTTEITDRSTFSELGYEGDPDGEFTPSGSRPVWADPGWSGVDAMPSIDASNRLVFDPSVNEVITTPIDVFRGHAFVWNVDRHDDSMAAKFAILDTNEGYDGGLRIQPENGYSVFYSQSGGSNPGTNLSVNVTGGTDRILTSGTGGDDPVEIRVEVDDSGHFEVFEDGESVGTVTDTTFDDTDQEQLALAHSDEGAEPVYVDYVEVYPLEDE